MLRGHPKVTDFEWLTKHLSLLLAWGDQAGCVQPEVFHDYGVHTALKLAALNHALDVFTPVGRSQADRGKHHHRSVYVDLFAGCGVTKTEKGDWLAGSPVIASHSKRPFDEMILVERAPARLAALRERVTGVPNEMRQDPTFLAGDCNGLRDRIVGLLEPDDLVFVCVDPEGMEAKWGTIQAIVDKCFASDLFINFTSGADRVRATAADSGQGGRALSEFTGQELTDLLAKTGEDVKVLSVYEENLAGQLGKGLGGSAEVRAVGGNPRYHVLIRTRVTPGGSPYWRGYEALVARLRGVSAEQALHAIDIVKGRLRQL